MWFGDDHQVRHDRLDHAILLIGRTIRELCGNRRGNFEVAATANGPEFRISIEGDRGGGIASMEILCLDMALFVVWSSKGEGPRFLTHESHLFDGVDARQIAIAIKTAGELARDWGVQYFVALNSDIFDTLPWPQGFDPGGAIVTPRLSDADDAGGLFGFRFD